MCQHCITMPYIDYNNYEKKIFKRNPAHVGMAQCMNALADKVQNQEVPACTQWYALHNIWPHYYYYDNVIIIWKFTTTEKFSYQWQCKKTAGSSLYVHIEPENKTKIIIELNVIYIRTRSMAWITRTNKVNGPIIVLWIKFRWPQKAITLHFIVL